MSTLSLQSFLRYCCLPGTSMSGSREKRKLPHNFWEKLTDFPFAPAQSSWLCWAHFWHVPRANFRKETPSWRRWFSAVTRIATTFYTAAGQCQAGSLGVRGTIFMTCEQRDAAASSPEHVAAVPVPSISRQSSVHLTAKKHARIPCARCAARMR